MTDHCPKELSATTYPGRGIVLGKERGRHTCCCIAYFIMGRSENTRNRVFETDGRGIRTRAFDESKMVGLCPSSSTPPCGSGGDQTIVTNGDQTDTIYDATRSGD